MHRRTTRCEHRINHQMLWTPSRPSATRHPPPSTRWNSQAGSSRLRPARREVPATGVATGQPREGQSTLCRDVQSSWVGGGGRQVGQEWVHTRGAEQRQRGATQPQNMGATPGGMRARAADKEEGGSKAGEATRTVGTGNQNLGDGRAFAWGAATTQGMVWPASPVATGCSPAQPASGGGFLVQYPTQTWVPQKKIAKQKQFWPFLPILDAAAEFLLIINSKHPAPKLGFRETLGFARYLSLHAQGSLHPVGHHWGP